MHLGQGAVFDSAAARTAAIVAVRQAALSDDSGKALDRALVQHGAAARAVKEQPVHWVKRRPGGRAGADVQSNDNVRAAGP